MSVASPTRFKGCLAALASRLASELSKFSASGVSVKDGPMALTRIIGANYAASALVSPSMAPLEAETKLWKGKPC